MKVVHVPFCFFPDPVGGTEIYVDSLARALRGPGIRSVIAAPGSQTAAYDHAGVAVRRFACSKALDLCDIYGDGDELAAAEFSAILDEESPDIVHLHAFSSAVSLRLVRAARARGIPIVFTYHTPTVSCQRGTLLRWGASICDGNLAKQPCVACTMHGKGLPRPIAAVFAALPAFATQQLARCASGRIATLLQMRTLIRQRQRCFSALMAEVDHVVAVSDWVRDLLIRNGVCESKITLSRQGLPYAEPAIESSAEGPPRKALTSANVSANPLKVAFLGRLDPSKGVHVLVGAFQSAPRLNATLHIFGIAQNGSGQSYAKRMRAAAGADTRIEFRDPVNPTEVTGLLRRYDILAVPSQVLETGPLVVLEAFAAGTPVLGSRLGGIAELIRDGENGLLVEPQSMDAWARALTEISADPARLNRLRDQTGAPRTASHVSAEMTLLYSRLASPPSPCSASRSETRVLT